MCSVVKHLLTTLTTLLVHVFIVINEFDIIVKFTIYSTLKTKD